MLYLKRLLYGFSVVIFMAVLLLFLLYAAVWGAVLMAPWLGKYGIIVTLVFILALLVGFLHTYAGT